MGSQALKQPDFIQDNYDSAEIALKYSRVMGAMPQAFSTGIRSLMADHKAGLLVMSRQSEFQVGRLLRAPSVLAAIYYGAKTFYPDKFTAGKLFSPMEVGRFFDPCTLASLLGMTYLFKRAKRVCDGEEWKFVAEALQRNLEIGVKVGCSVPGLGAHRGMLAGGVLLAAFSMFLAHDRKGFTDYRRHLKRAGWIYDPGYEFQQWGCTSVQVASNLLIGLGFGVDYAFDFARAFNQPLISGPQISEGWHKFMLVRRCLNGLYRARLSAEVFWGHLRSGVDPGAFCEELHEMFEKGSKFFFLDRRKDSLGEGHSPDLIICLENEAEEIRQQRLKSVPAQRCFYHELPEDIRELIPEDEFEQYKHLSVDEIIELVDEH